MLAKTGVHHYSGNNIELGTACGKYYRVCTLAIIDPGNSLLQCRGQMRRCLWILPSPVSSSTEQGMSRSDDTLHCIFPSGLTLKTFSDQDPVLLWDQGSQNLEALLLLLHIALLLLSPVSILSACQSCREVLVSFKQLYGTCFWTHQLGHELALHTVYNSPIGLFLVWDKGLWLVLLPRIVHRKITNRQEDIHHGNENHVKCFILKIHLYVITMVW